MYVQLLCYTWNLICWSPAVWGTSWVRQLLRRARHCNLFQFVLVVTSFLNSVCETIPKRTTTNKPTKHSQTVLRMSWNTTVTQWRQWTLHFSLHCHASTFVRNVHEPDTLPLMPVYTFADLDTTNTRNKQICRPKTAYAWWRANQTVPAVLGLSGRYPDVCIYGWTDATMDGW